MQRGEGWYSATGTWPTIRSMKALHCSRQPSSGDRGHSENSAQMIVPMSPEVMKPHRSLSAAMTCKPRPVSANRSGSPGTGTTAGVGDRAHDAVSWMKQAELDRRPCTGLGGRWPRVPQGVGHRRRNDDRDVVAASGHAPPAQSADREVPGPANLSGPPSGADVPTPGKQAQRRAHAPAWRQSSLTRDAISTAGGGQWLPTPRARRRLHWPHPRLDPRRPATVSPPV